MTSSYTAVLPCEMRPGPSVMSVAVTGSTAVSSDVPFVVNL